MIVVKVAKGTLRVHVDKLCSSFYRIIVFGVCLVLVLFDIFVLRPFGSVQCNTQIFRFRRQQDVFSLNRGKMPTSRHMCRLKLKYAIVLPFILFDLNTFPAIFLSH